VLFWRDPGRVGRATGIDPPAFSGLHGQPLGQNKGDRRESTGFQLEASNAQKGIHFWPVVDGPKTARFRVGVGCP